MPKNYCIMQIWAESGKSALPICNYSQILYQFLTFTQNLKRSRRLCYTFIHSMSLRFVIVFWQLNYTKTIGFMLFLCQLLLNFQGA